MCIRDSFYLYLPYHLAETNERQKLDALLLDPGWLMAKLTATGNTAALVADYDRYAAGEPQKVIGRTLRLTAGICARDQRQLIPQLLGRLMAVSYTHLDVYKRQACCRGALLKEST